MVAKTICDVVTDKLYSDIQYIVIPTTNKYDDKACTAILEWPLLTWTKIDNDIRTAPAGGQLTTFARNTRLLYLGGTHIKTGEPSLEIFEYDTKQLEWFKWSDRELPCPIWSVAPFSNINGVEYCETSKYVNSKMILDPRGEFQWDPNRTFHGISPLSGGDMIYEWESDILKAPNGAKINYP